MAQLTACRWSKAETGVKSPSRVLMSSAWLTPGVRHLACRPFVISEGSGCSQGHLYYVTGSNHPSPCFLFLICFRTWRSESAWGGFCEWTATPRCSPPKDSGTCPSRCQALRHLQAASGQPWLCQQNSWQVKARAPGFLQCFKERAKIQPAAVQGASVPVRLWRAFCSTHPALEPFQSLLRPPYSK